MSYRVEIGEAALRELLELPTDIRDRMKVRIDALAENFRPPGTRALAGKLKGLRRLRAGAYRMVYEVDDGTRLVTVRGMGHRSALYERIARGTR